MTLLKELKEYKFILPDGKKPTLTTAILIQQEYVEGILSNYNLELNEEGRFIITDAAAYKQFTDNLPNRFIDETNIS